MFKISPDPFAGPLRNTKTAEIFWGEMAPCQHVAQVYESDAALLDHLTAFFTAGFHSGESAIVIATPEHMRELHDRLSDAKIDVSDAILKDALISVDAETALSKFMIKQWPVEELFFELIQSLLDRAAAGRRKVRAFGEMVALLWARGDTAATVHLEFLWEELRKTYPISLYCAYPMAGFTKAPEQSIRDICAVHSQVFC